MCWIGRRKGRVGGNPGAVHKSDGDLPQTIERGGGLVGRKDLIAVLTGNAKVGRNKQATAPWKSGGIGPSSSMPGPRSSSLTSPDLRLSGEPRKVQVDLPPWMKVDAHLCYSSRSTGKVVEVVVEMVNHNKCEVEITFVEDSKVWKVIPFTVIASDSTPLLGPWPPGSSSSSREDLLRLAQHAKPDKTEMIRRLQSSSTEALPGDTEAGKAAAAGASGGDNAGDGAATAVPKASADADGSGGSAAASEPGRPSGATETTRDRSRSRRRVG